MQSGYLSCAFDLLNIGDLDIVRQARTLCDHLIVGVFTDEYILRTTGRPPVVPLAERMLLLTHVRGVTDVVAHDPEPARRGGDEAAADVVFAVEGVRYESDQAGQVVWLSRGRETSSTMLREALEPAPILAVA